MPPHAPARLYRRILGSIVGLSAAATLVATADTAAASISTVPDVHADSEVYNSGRGLYSWLTIPTQIPGWTYQDVYWRDQIQWGSKVERTRGAYDFSAFDTGLAEAARTGGRFSFRVMALCPGCGGNLAPSYVPKQANGAPDWNSEAFLAGYENLMKALGARYDRDPRLGVIDVGAYGMWGEWYCDDSQCGVPLTDANAERLIRAASNAFPNKYFTLGFDLKTAQMAARINPKIGMRFDCIGGPFDMTLKYLPEDIKNVWKRAPVIGEWCPIPGTTAERGVNHVKELHLSALSSGNFPVPYGQLSAAEQSAYRRAYTLSGFRYSATTLDAPASVAAGRTATVKLTIKNTGVAPTYDSWRTSVHLLDSSGRSVATAAFPIDLKSLAEGSQTTAAAVAVPTTLRGTYRIAISANDTAGYLKPLTFANPGRDSAGRYVVGALTVARAR